MLKKLTLLMIFVLIPIFTQAKRLVKIGVLNMNKLGDEFPEAKEMKEKWEAFLVKKFFWLNILKDELESIDKLKNDSLSEKTNSNIKKILLKQEINKLLKLRNKKLKHLKSKQGRQLRKRIFLAIKQARRKKGFGIVISSKQKLILYYDERTLDLNPYVLNELIPPIQKTK